MKVLLCYKHHDEKIPILCTPYDWPDGLSPKEDIVVVEDLYGDELVVERVEVSTVEIANRSQNGIRILIFVVPNIDSVNRDETCEKLKRVGWKAL